MLTRAEAHQPPTSWFHEWRLPNGQIWLYFSRDGESYILSFPGLAEFQISGADILCYPAPDIPIESLKHLLLDQVLPLLLSQRGKLVLHASSVSGPAGAWAFTGPSGQGKSTLAASFTTQGYELLTDDCLMLEYREGGIFGTPLYASLRLYPEVIETLFPGQEQSESNPVTHYSSKLRLGLEPSGVRIQIQPVRLKRIYILSPENAPEVSIAPLGFREAFLEIVKLTYLMDVHDPGTLKSEFESIASAAALPLFRRLTYPREFSALPSVRSAILSDVS